MTPEPLRHLRGIAAPLLRDNVDTDAIAPSRLRVPGLGKTGYEAILFGNWRREHPDFVLDQPAYRHATILVSGANFGCGSSRETAAWALRGFGIRAVIAPSFGSIFQANCYRNGILPLPLNQPDHTRLTTQLYGPDGRAAEAEIDLEQQTVRAVGGDWIPFSIDEHGRRLLLAGLDEIGELMRYRDTIDQFRDHDRLHRPWLYN